MKKTAGIVIFIGSLLMSQAAFAAVSGVSFEDGYAYWKVPGTGTTYGQILSVAYQSSCNVTSGLRNCESYYLMAGPISNGRLSYTRTQAEKSGPVGFQDYYWNALDMSDPYPSTSRSWGSADEVSVITHDGEYITYKAREWHTYSDEDSENYTLYVKNDKPEVRMRFQWFDGTSNYDGVEFNLRRP